MNHFEKVNCDYCKSREHKTILKTKDWFNKIEGEYTLVKCKKCGLLFTNPRPTIDTIKSFYPDNTSYYIPQTINFNNTIYQKHHAYLSTFLNYPKKNNRANTVIQYIKYKLHTHLTIKRKGVPDFIPKGQLLDIGCSFGFFLSEMKYLGWETVGIETNSKAADFGRKILNLNIKNCSFEDFISDDKFDTITMRMVLEHVFSPSKVLTKVSSHLKPGGKLILSVPSIGFEAKIYKKYAYTLQLPTHLTHFTPQTIKRLLKSQGYRNIKIYFQPSMTDIIKPLDYMIEDGKKVKWIKSIIQTRIVSNYIFPFF